MADVFLFDEEEICELLNIVTRAVPDVTIVRMYIFHFKRDYISPEARKKDMNKMADYLKLKYGNKNDTSN